MADPALDRSPLYGLKRVLYRFHQVFAGLFGIAAGSAIATYTPQLKEITQVPIVVGSAGGFLGSLTIGAALGRALFYKSLEDANDRGGPVGTVILALISIILVFSILYIITLLVAYGGNFEAVLNRTLELLGM